MSCTLVCMRASSSRISRGEGCCGGDRVRCSGKRARLELLEDGSWGPLSCFWCESVRHHLNGFGNFDMAADCYVLTGGLIAFSEEV
jgi:hypothetical protein